MVIVRCAKYHKKLLTILKMFDTIKALSKGNAMGKKIKVNYIPSTHKGVIGYDGKKLFVTRWKKLLSKLV